MQIVAFSHMSFTFVDQEFSLDSWYVICHIMSQIKLMALDSELSFFPWCRNGQVSHRRIFHLFSWTATSPCSPDMQSAKLYRKLNYEFRRNGRCHIVADSIYFRGPGILLAFLICNLPNYLVNQIKLITVLRHSPFFVTEKRPIFAFSHIPFNIVGQSFSLHSCYAIYQIMSEIKLIAVGQEFCVFLWCRICQLLHFRIFHLSSRVRHSRCILICNMSNYVAN